MDEAEFDKFCPGGLQLRETGRCMRPRAQGGMLGEGLLHPRQYRLDRDLRHVRLLCTSIPGARMIDRVETRMVRRPRQLARRNTMVETHQRNIEGAHKMRGPGIDAHVKVG